MTFWEREVELPHVLEVGFRESTSEVLGKAAGELLDERPAVGGPLLAALLLHDALADLPVCVYHGGVHGMVGLAARPFQDLRDAFVEARRQSYVVGCRPL